MTWPLPRRIRPAVPPVPVEPAGRDLVDDAEIAELDEQIYLDSVVRHANGTVQLVIKGHQPLGNPRQVAP